MYAMPWTRRARIIIITYVLDRFDMYISRVELSRPCAGGAKLERAWRASTPIGSDIPRLDNFPNLEFATPDFAITELKVK